MSYQMRGGNLANLYRGGFAPQNPEDFTLPRLPRGQSESSYTNRGGQ